MQGVDDFPMARMTHMHGYTSASRFHSAKTMVWRRRPHNLCTQSDIRPLVRGRRHPRSRMITKWLALKRQKVKVRVRGRRRGRCETNLVNAVLISFVDQLIHNVQSPTDVWNWSLRFSDGEDDAHARLHIGIKLSCCKDDGLATATPQSR